MKSLKTRDCIRSFSLVVVIEREEENGQFAVVLCRKNRAVVANKRVLPSLVPRPVYVSIIIIAMLT